MIIKDFFSHKIHSSGDDWPDKLISIATIFNEFDGQPYDRDKITQRLSGISSRISGVRDASKFRDEISAYSSYLGVYKLELVNDIWHIFLTETAKRFLINEEPDVASFLILQLSLFQFPNNNGVARKALTNQMTVQANAKEKTKSYLQNGITLSPLRLICKAIFIVAEMQNIDVFDAKISKKLLFALANDTRTNNDINPSQDNLKKVILDFNAGKVEIPANYESRFHLLEHTGLIKTQGENISLRNFVNEGDKKNLLQTFNAILTLSTSYHGFEGCNFEIDDELTAAIKSDTWAKYFDGVVTLPMNFCDKITSNTHLSDTVPRSSSSTFKVKQAANLYDFKEFDFSKTSYHYSNSQNMKSDPEVTRILRQRANLTHKILLEKLHNHLISLGVTPFENEHVDMYAPISDEISFIFEVKSLSAENLLSQTRKGLSQLYEYRYRYRDIVGPNPELCLVFPVEPTGIDWLQNYLISDRRINIVWFDELDKFKFPEACHKSLRELALA